MSRLLRCALAIGAVVAIAAAMGCGGDDDSGAEATTTSAAPAATSAPATATAPATTAPAKATVKVDADQGGQLAFVQKSLTAPAGDVTFRFTNASSVPHNFAIEGNGVEEGPTATIAGGDVANLTVDLKPGTYEFYCAVPGHEEGGMKGTLTVK
jgi:plastocyanin